MVFDCSARFNGTSLNDQLFPGPELTNRLVGVLARFRQEPIAFIGDIEAMFHQVRVPKYHRDFLRFLWWPDGDLSRDLEEYQMNVHLFGAVSSPSCSNFALRRVADDAENHVGCCPVGEQKKRLTPAQPFTYCGADYFGPFRIKEGRKELKHYSVLFTCLSSRAVHIEATNSLETNSFLNTLCHFIARRGPVCEIRSDQGTNIVGAEKELKKALDEMDHSIIQASLCREYKADWIIQWKQNPTVDNPLKSPLTLKGSQMLLPLCNFPFLFPINTLFVQL